MKYLTAPYLTLMNAFKDHSEDVLSKQTYKQDRIANMQEHCTLRIDGGRQTGKTEAVSMFARDWIEDGGQVICLADTVSFAKCTADRIMNKHGAKLRHDIRGKVFTQSIRSFLSDSMMVTYRGYSFSKILIIIDEPCSRMPEIYKFYKAFEDNLAINTLYGGSKLPLFFVIGIQ